MDCPRCDSPLDAYTIEGSQAAMCDRCGWVGIDASLGGRGDAGSTNARDDARDGGSERRDAAVSPAAAGDDPESSVETGPEAVPAPADATDRGDADDAPLDTLDGIDTDDVEQFRTTGIRTIGELARAEPSDLADATDLPEGQVRTHVRRAAIRAVTREGDPDDVDG